MSRDPSQPLYNVGYGRSGRCGFVVDVETVEPCDKPAVYRLRLRRWSPVTPDGGACAEHGAIARTYPDLAWMRSYAGGAA